MQLEDRKNAPMFPYLSALFFAVRGGPTSTGSVMSSGGVLLLSGKTNACMHVRGMCLFRQGLPHYSAAHASRWIRKKLDSSSLRLHLPSSIRCGGGGGAASLWHVIIGSSVCGCDEVMFDEKKSE